MKKQEYYRELEKLGVIKPIFFSEQESERFKGVPSEDLPDDVYWENTGDSTRYFHYPDMPDAEINKAISLLNAKNISAIKGCVVFFTVIAVIGICAAIVLLSMR